MNLSNIVDYKNYKIVLFIYVIIIFLIILNKYSLFNLFRIKINTYDFNLFIFSIILAGSIFLIIYPLVKLKLVDLSGKKNLNKEKLYDPLHTIKINKNIENILYKLNEFIPVLCILFYIYLCINNNNINAISYFLLGISVIFIIKCIISLCTIIPDASQKCKIKLLNGSCNDLLCSGHFSIVFLIYLLIIKYKLMNKNNNYLVLLIVILYGFIPIITKKHYTIDILVATIIILLVNNYIPKK